MQPRQNHGASRLAATGLALCTPPSGGSRSTGHRRYACVSVVCRRWCLSVGRGNWVEEWESLESWNWVAQRPATLGTVPSSSNEVPKALGVPPTSSHHGLLLYCTVLYRMYMGYAAAAFAGWVRAAWLSAWLPGKRARYWLHARSAARTPRTPGTGTAVLLRWLAGNRSRAVFLGPEGTKSDRWCSVPDNAVVHHTVCARRAAWRRDSMLLPVQHRLHSTARHSTAQL